MLSEYVIRHLVFLCNYEPLTLTLTRSRLAYFFSPFSQK